MLTVESRSKSSRRVGTPGTELRVVHLGQDPVQVESDLCEVAVVPWPAKGPAPIPHTDQHSAPELVGKIIRLSLVAIRANSAFAFSVKKRSGAMSWSCDTRNW